jgi:hypothetical protein
MKTVKKFFLILLLAGLVGGMAFFSLDVVKPEYKQVEQPVPYKQEAVTE